MYLCKEKNSAYNKCQGKNQKFRRFLDSGIRHTKGTYYSLSPSKQKYIKVHKVLLLSGFHVRYVVFSSKACYM